MVEIFDVLNGRKIEVEIVSAARTELPSKSHGWNFDWIQLVGAKNTRTFALRLIETPKTIEGMLQIRVQSEVCIMELVEIAPHNIGHNKRYEKVAECLIAFACRESFSMEGDYKGYLAFVSKTNLIQWYSKKYGAKQAVGQKMYIDPETGLRLIEKYLNK